MIDRRRFLLAVCATGACAGRAVALAPRSAGTRAAVHDGQPYLDVSADSPPYHPPAGLRGADPVSGAGPHALAALLLYA